MNRTEKEYDFPKADQGRETYFSPAVKQPLINEYTFNTLPQFRKMLKERLGDELSDSEILEIARLTFRNKPREINKPPEKDDRELVDFVYELL